MHNIIACELVSAVEKNTLSALKYVTDLKLKKLNIKWGGYTASTSWEYNDKNELISNINFPPIKADAKITNYMAEVYTGFALHEIGHNLCTQKDVWNKAVALERRGQVGITRLLNALEDPRQEKELLSRCHFEGAKNVLEKLTAWAVDESIKNGFKADDPRNFSYCLNILAYIDMCGYSVPSIGSAEDLLVSSGKLRHDLETALIKLKACKNTQDVLDLCIELMGQYSNQNQNQSNQGMGVPEKSEDGSESSEDKSEDGSESSEDGSESSEDKSEDGSESSEDGSESSKDKSEDGSESSEDGSESSEDSSESSSSSQNTVNVDRSGEEEQSGGSISIDLSDQSFKNKEDYLQEDAKNNPDKNVDGDRHSRNEDLKAETYNVNQMVDCDDEYLSRRLDNKLKSVDRALKLVNVSDCSQTLSRILKNPDRRGSKRHRDRGKLDVRKLGKLCTNTPNMFYQPWKQKGTKTAVSLLIDTSSSMRDRDWGNIRVNNAKESINLAMILGNALHKVQVKYAVGCYPYAETQRGQVVSLSEGTEYYDDPYTLLKDHDHNWIKSKKFIASQHGKAGGGTPTHQAMMAEGLRLRKRSEDRKVMIIITDGAPNSIKRTQQAKKIMAKWGIEVIGLILCLYKIYAHIDPQQQKRLDEFVKDFDGCFDHFVVEGSAKDMIKKGLHDLNKILR
jgi:hypothetical protein